MSHINDRLDLDNAFRAFSEKSDDDDFVLYFRHNYKDGEGVCFTDMKDMNHVPLITEDAYVEFGEMATFKAVQSVVLTLAADLLTEDESLQQRFIKFLTENKNPKAITP